ncbi:MAG TPA: hypothetical protein VFW07_09210 [Parafilimonas sp.]|nr:hypothetical protein [Parafilimonas sp.]
MAINGNFSYLPGDTFVLKPGIDYTYFVPSNVHDVTVINEGGVVHLQNGFNLSNCKNITITGSGSVSFMDLRSAVILPVM